MIKYQECPACGRKRTSRVNGFSSVYRCKKCDAVYGTCTLGDSYTLVLPYFHTSPDDPDVVERIRYYDLMCLGSEGITRRHGWYDPETRRITQVG